MQEEKLWTSRRIILMIMMAVVSLISGGLLVKLGEWAWVSWNLYASGTPPEQVYIPPPSTASPETVVIRPEPGAKAVVSPKFFLTVDIVDGQGNPLVATVTVNYGYGNAQCSTKDPATQNFLAIPMKYIGGEEDHEMLEVIAQVDGYYPARQKFDVTTLDHSSYHLVLTLEEVAPEEAPQS